MYIGCSLEQDKTVKMSDQELAKLRVCGAAECEYKVPNGVKSIFHILKALNKHILATHSANQKPTGWGSA